MFGCQVERRVRSADDAGHVMLNGEVALAEMARGGRYRKDKPLK
jgi:hypothetical protein